MSEELKLAREKAGYTIEDVAKQLKIQKKFIKDIEESNYDEIPGKIYVEGYKKMYYDFLDIKEKSTTRVFAPKTIRANARLDKESSYEKHIILVSVTMIILLSVLYTYIT